MKSEKSIDTTESSSSTRFKKNLQSITKIIQLAVSQLRQTQQNEMPLRPQISYIKRISLNLEQQKIDRVLQQLHKGYIVKKHSPNTQQPHDKFVYISEDHRFFCWKSVDKEDQKSLELRKVINIYKGIEMAKSKTIKKVKQAKNCLIIVGESRSLQIQTNNQEIVQWLYEGIQQVVKNSKRMHLSYKF